MKKNIFFFSLLLFSFVLFVQDSFAVDVPLKRSSADTGSINYSENGSRSRVYIPLSVSFESGELGLFFESAVGMCNVSIEDENGNVQMSETIDTDNGTEFWFDLSGLSSGLHYVKISYGSINLVGEFYVE